MHHLICVSYLHHLYSIFVCIYKNVISNLNSHKLLVLALWRRFWLKVSQIFFTVICTIRSCVTNTSISTLAVLDTHGSLKKSYLSRFCWEQNSCTFCQIPLKKFLLINPVEICQNSWFSNVAGAQLLSKRYEGGHLRAPQQKGVCLFVRLLKHESWRWTWLRFCQHKFLF